METNFFGGIFRDFPGISRGVPEKFEKKRFASAETKLSRNIILVSQRRIEGFARLQSLKALTSLTKELDTHLVCFYSSVLAVRKVTMLFSAGITAKSNKKGV